MNGLCSHERLELALEGLLNASDESTLHGHLEKCELCSAEMERLSGGEQAFNEITSMLTPDDLEDALPMREECSTADFVIDHLEPSDDPAAMGRLGGYDVLDVIGQGGMGVVLKGFDRELKRFVAIKALAPHLAHSALARKRFAREAQAAAAVVNLHVIAIHQVQPNGQLPFLVMPLLTGESLAQRLKSRGTLDLKEILRIGMQAAEGLAAAHEQGLIHRDVKPANILLEKGVERAVLTDFGLARAADDVSMTRWGIIAGTPEYMSPEQARGETLDARSDLFSLGCVLYEMATGVSPFRTDSSMATMRRLVHETPKSLASLNPELPPWFIAIVNRLLEKNPSRRFGSAKEVSELLEGCLAHVQQPATVPLPDSLLPHATRGRWIFNSRRKGMIAMLGALVISLLGMLLWQASEAPDIAGQWTGEDWGQVVLEQKQTGGYDGTYTDTFGKEKGKLQLKWSRVERRFNGTWQEGKDRCGKVSVRLVDDEIRGAWTANRKSGINPGTPGLADLLWKRRGDNNNEYRTTPGSGLRIQVPREAAAVAKATFGPAKESMLPYFVDCRQQYFQFRSGEIFVVGNGPGTSKEEAAHDEKRIEDAGGVDMSANRNEERIFISGRGCFFTRDVEELKWDSITAEQVVQAMKRVRHVEGEVTPMKKDLPVSYLFKTARGEVGIMEVLGNAEVKHEGWTENGMKFRYKLVQGAGTTTAAAPPLVFGAGTQGLQAALEVAPGEPFKLRIHIRNVSDHGIAIDGVHYRQEDECLLTDPQGQPVPVAKVTHDIKMGMKGGYFSPGQVAVFESAGLSFQSIDKVPSSAGYVAQASPGRYTLRVRLRLPGDDVPFAADKGVWHGELETGPVTIEVKDPATQTVAPVADSIYSSILGPAIERTVNDLQTARENCALSFDSGKLLPVPANITLDTLTNASAQPVAVAWARDNQVDAVAFVTTDAGQVVKCGLLCPGLVVLRANNAEWDPNMADSRMLKEDFEEAMHHRNFIPQFADVTTDGQFPANYLILDTRTHRRGVLQILGVSDKPRGVKIRYRLVEGAPVKQVSQTVQPTAP